MFKRGKIASKRAFNLYRSETVAGESGSREENYEPDKVIYGTLQSRNFGRLDEQGRINESVQYEVHTDYFTPMPKTGDKLEFLGQNWIIHVVENVDLLNRHLRLHISRES